MMVEARRNPRVGKDELGSARVTRSASGARRAGFFLVRADVAHACGTFLLALFLEFLHFRLSFRHALDP
jgi:hypothetical protein